MPLIRNAVLLAGLFFSQAFSAAIYTFQPITPCSGCGTLVSGINNSGAIAGSVYDSTGVHGFYRTDGTYTFFDQPGAFLTEAIGITDSGRVTVNYFAPNGTGRAYILEPSGIKTILPVVAGASYTLGGNLNESGIAVGFYTSDPAAGGPSYVLAGTALSYTFSFPGALITQALGINNAGVIVGQYQISTSSAPHGFIRNLDGTLQRFDVPGAFSTAVYDINNLGDLAGNYLDSSGRQHGVIYQNGVFTTLDYLPTSTTIFAINDFGQAVGASYPAGGLFTGPYSGFVATPVPEPSALVLVSCGLALLLFRRRS